MANRLQVALVYGGQSVEHKVSCRSAKTVFHHLVELGHTVVPIGISRDGRWSLQPVSSFSEEEPTADFIKSEALSVCPGSGVYHMDGKNRIPIDIVFPVTHGTGGEDGRLQGLLESAHLPYVGCTAVASMIGMHKLLAKIHAKEMGVPILPSLVVDKRRITLANGSDDPYPTQLHREAVSRLGTSLVVKPEDGGSSVGVDVLEEYSVNSLLDAIIRTGIYTNSIMLEPLIKDVRELEVAVITNGAVMEASDPGLIVDPEKDETHIVSYQHKYLVANSAYLQLPAPLPKEMASTISEYAIRIAKSIGVTGYARIDFFQDPNDDTIYFNEINTLPGMTSKSHFPILAASMDYDWPKLLTVLLEEGFAAHRLRSSYSTLGVE